MTNDSLLDIYARLAKYDEIFPDKMHINFVTFATKYKLVNSKLGAQPDIIPRFFPVYLSNNKEPNFPLYCKYQLLRYKPWHTNTTECLGMNHALKNFTSPNEKISSKHHAQQHVPEWCESLYTVQTYSEDDTLNIPLKSWVLTNCEPASQHASHANQH